MGEWLADTPQQCVCVQDFFAISYISRLFLLNGLEIGEPNITLCIFLRQIGRA